MNGFDKSQLTKGHLRKLEALRKSLGTDIADKAFAKWIAKQSEPVPGDRNAAAIAEALMPLIEQGKLRIPRGGYLVRRGRGRMIVEPVKDRVTANAALGGQPSADWSPSGTARGGAKLFRDIGVALRRYVPRRSDAGPD